jgi:predicted O-methyltransferase YrrM
VELVDGTTGFLLTGADFKSALIIAIPSFEVSVIKLDMDLTEIEVPLNLGCNVIDEGFLDSLVPSAVNDGSDIEARKQVRDIIDNAVLKFIQFSYANEQSLMWGGGTVDTTEFSALISLAEEASTFQGPIIEIGTLFGYSTNALAIGKAPHIPLITVDAFTWNPMGVPNWRHEELTRKGLSYLVAKQNVRLVKSTADSFYQSYDGGQPSLVFIDADHSYEAVRKDIDFAKRVGARIICGDDFSWPGVKRAVEESFGRNYQTIGDMWVFKTTGTSAPCIR